MDKNLKYDSQCADTDAVMRKRRRRLTLATAAAGGVVVVGTAIPLFMSMLPSERAKNAGAPVEVDTAQLEPGQLLTVEWRGKPVWILRRSAEMIDALSRHDHLLRDRLSVQSRQPSYAVNAARSIRLELFIAIALCTHLGCIPTMRKDAADSDLGPQWPGGFFCPCHGSKFDFAGRVFKNVPAPTNLEIPRHAFLSDTRLLIGEDEITSRS